MALGLLQAVDWGRLKEAAEVFVLVGAAAQARKAKAPEEKTETDDDPEPEGKPERGPGKASAKEWGEVTGPGDGSD
jgi:hypothetical protein